MYKKYLKGFNDVFNSPIFTQKKNYIFREYDLMVGVYN